MTASVEAERPHPVNPRTGGHRVSHGRIAAAAIDPVSASSSGEVRTEGRHRPFLGFVEVLKEGGTVVLDWDEPGFHEIGPRS